MIKIDYEKCCFKDGKCVNCGCDSAGCDGCVEVCPVGALSREKTVVIDNSKCLDCGACIEACKHGAISMM